MIFRVYFNTCLDWPQCWSIDEGDQSTESNVQGIELGNCPWQTNQLPREAREGIDPKRVPSAWIEVTAARCELRGGKAYFSPL